jgi:hypothetical protein
LFQKPESNSEEEPNERSMVEGPPSITTTATSLSFFFLAFSLAVKYSI